MQLGAGRWCCRGWGVVEVEVEVDVEVKAEVDGLGEASKR